jgi:acyl carrier protein
MMNSEAEMLEIVLGIIRDMGHDTTGIEPETALTACGIDSLQAVDLVFRLEEEFNITIDMADFRPRTVGEAVGLLLNLLPDTHSAPAA